MNVTQDLLWDYNFLSKSETVFKRLQLSGTFSEDANVYPEVLFNDVRLLADLINVSSDGNRITMLNKTVLIIFEGVLSIVTEAVESQALVSMSLFGRVYSKVNFFCANFHINSGEYNFRILVILTNFVLLNCLNSPEYLSLFLCQ